jgi:hypothetical protein
MTTENVMFRRHGHRLHANAHTVALLNIEPLQSIICGELTQNRSAISRYFPHKIVNLSVQYSILEMLQYTNLCKRNSIQTWSALVRCV